MKFLVVALFFLLPMSALASHNSRSLELGGKPVDEIPVPVLFGVDLDSLRPDFGDPRGGGTRTHEGQDFLAPKGTPIVSPTEAIVLGIGTWEGGGKYVQTANPGGERFRYMHLDEWADLERGDRLKAGDYIGTVGDTGNAAAGQYHLHFETLDKAGTPQDPHPRLTEDWDLEDKIGFLDDVFDQRRDDREYAEFLVETFPREFRQAVQEGIELPRAIKRVIDTEGWEANAEQVAQLTKLIESIPALLNTELATGDSGARVILLQLYLIYGAEGPARDRLAAAGPTGYYGSITASAVAELQDKEDIDASGVYDSRTRTTFAARNLRSLALGQSELAK